MKEIFSAIWGFVVGWLAGSWFLGNLLLIWAFSFPLTLKGMQCGIFKNKAPLIAEYWWMAIWILCLIGTSIAVEYYLSNPLYAYPVGLGLAFLFAVNRSGPSDKNVALYLRLYGRSMDLPKFDRLRSVLLKLPPETVPAAEKLSSQDESSRARKNEALRI